MIDEGCPELPRIKSFLPSKQSEVNRLREMSSPNLPIHVSNSFLLALNKISDQLNGNPTTEAEAWAETNKARRLPLIVYEQDL